MVNAALLLLHVSLQHFTGEETAKDLLDLDRCFHLSKVLSANANA